LRGILLALLLASSAAAQTPPSGTTYGYTKVDLSQTGTNTNPVRVTGTITSLPPVVVSTGSITAYQGGTWTVQQGSPPWSVTFPSPQSVTLTLTTYTVIASNLDIRALTRARDQVSVDSSTVYIAGGLPLPAGAATSANQALEIDRLVAIDTNTAAGATSAGQATALARLVAIDSNTAAAFRAGQNIGNTAFALNAGSAQIGTVSGSTVTAYQGGAPWSATLTLTTYTVISSNLDIRALTRARDQVSIDSSTIYNIQVGTADANANMRDGSGTPLTSTLVNARQALDFHQADTSFIVSGLTAVGSAPTLNPVSVSGVDSAGLKRHLLLDTSGRVTLSPITNGVGTSTGAPIIEIHDAGRQVVISSAASAAGVTAEALFTLTTSTGFTNGTSGTSFGVPAGKTFRIQKWGCTWHDTAAVVGAGTCRLRIASNGACTVSSPMADHVGAGANTNAAALNASAHSEGDIFDGLEISGNNTFCISHLDNSVLITVDANIVGYQY